VVRSGSAGRGAAGLYTAGGGSARGVSEFFLADLPVAVGVESGKVGGARVGVELVLGLLPVCEVLTNQALLGLDGISIGLLCNCGRTHGGTNSLALS
jgi:hypothetical protein